MTKFCQRYKRTNENEMVMRLLCSLSSILVTFVYEIYLTLQGTIGCMVTRGCLYLLYVYYISNLYLTLYKNMVLNILNSQLLSILML